MRESRFMRTRVRFLAGWPTTLGFAVCVLSSCGRNDNGRSLRNPFGDPIPPVLGTADPGIAGGSNSSSSSGGGPAAGGTPSFGGTPTDPPPIIEIPAYVDFDTEAVEKAIGEVFKDDQAGKNKALDLLKLFTKEMNETLDTRANFLSRVDVKAFLSSAPQLGTENISVIEENDLVAHISLGKFSDLKTFEKNLARVRKVIAETDEDPDHGDDPDEDPDLPDGPGSPDSPDHAQPPPHPPIVPVQPPGGGVSKGGQAPVLWNQVLLRPFSGRISSKFGMRKNPVVHVKMLHAGVDLPAVYGTLIPAAAEGLVVATGWMNACGWGVKVKISETEATVYCHLSRILCRKGQYLSIMSTVGEVGSSGRATGPHLHLGLKRNDKFIDPLPFLKPRKGQKTTD